MLLGRRGPSDVGQTCSWGPVPLSSSPAGMAVVGEGEENSKVKKNKKPINIFGKRIK